MNTNPLLILRSTTTYQGETNIGSELKQFKSITYGYRAGFALLHSLVGNSVSSIADHFKCEEKDIFIKKVCKLSVIKIKATDELTEDSQQAISIVHAIALFNDKSARLDDVKNGFKTQTYFV